MKKTLVFLTLVVVMIVGSVSMVFADDDLETPEPVDLSTITTDDTGNLIDKGTGDIGMQDATQSDIAYWDNLTKPDNKLTVRAYPPYWMPLPGTFPYIGQEQSYSCGPACVRMALCYLTGINYPEATIISGCGTTSTGGTSLSNMVSYINSKQTKNIYIANYKKDKTQMKNNIYSGTTSYSAPPIVGLGEGMDKGWPFFASRHIITIYSVLSDKSQVAICDPLGSYMNNNAGRWYNKTTDDLYTAHCLVNIGYMW